MLLLGQRSSMFVFTPATMERRVTFSDERCTMLENRVHIVHVVPPARMTIPDCAVRTLEIQPTTI